MKRRKVRATGKRVALVVFLLMSCSALANSSRLIVVNEVLDPARGASSTIELYLSRLGTYYAELYLEHDGGAAPPAMPVDISLSLTVLRGDEVILERDVVARFEAGQAVTTLLFLDIPRDLPQRKALELVVDLDDIGPALGATGATTLRLQLTRKPQLLPLRR